jgi:hypothetical protein
MTTNEHDTAVRDVPGRSRSALTWLLVVVGVVVLAGAALAVALVADDSDAGRALHMQPVAAMGMHRDGTGPGPHMQGGTDRMRETCVRPTPRHDVMRQRQRAVQCDRADARRAPRGDEVRRQQHHERAVHRAVHH